MRLILFLLREFLFFWWLSWEWPQELVTQHCTCLRSKHSSAEGSKCRRPGGFKFKFKLERTQGCSLRAKFSTSLSLSALTSAFYSWKGSDTLNFKEGSGRKHSFLFILTTYIAKAKRFPNIYQVSLLPIAILTRTQKEHGKSAVRILDGKKKTLEKCTSSQPRQHRVTASGSSADSDDWRKLFRCFVGSISFG